jgi:hypothetical protein
MTRVLCGSLVLLILAGCAGAPVSRQARFNAGADAALAEVARRYAARQHQALLAPGARLPDACGATGRQTVYGTVHIAGGVQNGMWVPPHEVVVVYRGQVVRPACASPPGQGGPR